MRTLPYARMVMTASLIAFFAGTGLTTSGLIGTHEQYVIQAIAMSTFGLGFGTTAFVMRTWMWKPSIIVAIAQTMMGIAYLVWMSGVFR